MHKDDFGINIIGYSTGNLGLGNTVRQFSKSILSHNIPIRILDLDPGEGRGKFDTTFSHLEVSDACKLPYSVNLYIFGANSIPTFSLYPPKILETLNTKDRLNVAFIWWELPDIPDYWIEAIRSFDVLIAGSGFIQETLSNHIPGIPVLLAPHPIDLPVKISPDRAKFDLPTDKLLVYTGFEPSSNLDRKNPFSSITAFQNAFPNHEDSHLVIKINNPNAQGAGEIILNELYVKIKDDPRIHIIKERLPYTDLLSLYASCDIFLSLHRSEGLGLIPLEAMRLGKVVIATGWSGNMSYMNHLNSCPVTYDFMPIPENSPVYGLNDLGIKSYWAEPNTNHAVKWLKKLYSDRELRISIGERAAEEMVIYEKKANDLDFVNELRIILKNKDMLPIRDRKIILKKAMHSKHISELKRLPPIIRYLQISKNYILSYLKRYLLWRFTSTS